MAAYFILSMKEKEKKGYNEGLLESSCYLNLEDLIMHDGHLFRVEADRSVHLVEDCNTCINETPISINHVL